MKILFYFGPKRGFDKQLPCERKTLSELVAEDDAKRKQVTHVAKSEDGREVEPIKIGKLYCENLVAYSESYSGITESAVQGFLNILGDYKIDHLYLQNPPTQIQHQLIQTYPTMVSVRKFGYKKFSKSMFHKIDEQFERKIIGQIKVKKRLLISLYPLIAKNVKRKPVVMMFYGNSGIGKTETARFISEIMGQKLLRKQLSMFQSGEFQNYLFGGNHAQSCFARDLLERESNVILLDEFDKLHPVFHNAFYQLFDEGVFEDKNYKVELYNSIIICTSNYQSEAEIRKNLGDPIFFRFDKFIHFEDLDIGALKLIISKHIEERFEKLSHPDKLIVDREYIKKQLYDNVTRLSNVRQISNIVEEYFGMQLVENILENGRK